MGGGTKPAGCRAARPERDGFSADSGPRSDERPRAGRMGHRARPSREGRGARPAPHTCTDSPQAVGQGGRVLTHGGRARPGALRHAGGRCSEEGGTCCLP